jgi:hypothetical protein
MANASLSRRFRKIFREQGLNNDIEIARAVQKTRSGSARAETTIYTGINKLMNKGMLPSEAVVEGIREAAGYNPEIDRILGEYGVTISVQQAYGAAPSGRQKGKGAAAKEKPPSKIAQLEDLLQQIGPTRDEAFRELLDDLKVEYTAGTPKEKQKLYTSTLRAYKGYLAQK